MKLYWKLNEIAPQTHWDCNSSPTTFEKPIEGCFYKLPLYIENIVYEIRFAIFLIFFFIKNRLHLNNSNKFDRRVNQQVQNYKTCLKNSHLGVEKFNFSLGLLFNLFCVDIILLSV